MQAFRYKGYDSQGNRVEGEVTAANIDEAERRIQQKSTVILSIVPGGMKKSGSEGDVVEAPASKPSLFAKKATDADAAAILRNLSVMSETGVPFVEGLDAVIQSARTPQIADNMNTVKREVIGGKPLSSAIRAVPNLFPTIVSDLVRVAEEGGRLDQALLNGAIYLERASEVRKRVWQAMIYPLVMMFVAMATIVVMIVFVLPRFNEIFTRMHADLPITTKLLMDVGAAFAKNPVGSSLVMVAIIIAAICCFKVPAVRQMMIRLAWRTPAVGDLLRDLALSRAFQSIATMLSGNVPLMQALEHGANVAAHEHVSKGLTNAKDMVEHGKALSDGLKASPVFPKVLIQMVSVGERTGRLSSLLVVTAKKMEEDADARLKSVVSIMEPLLIVVMGLVVGSITVSIISPIYSVIEKVK